MSLWACHYASVETLSPFWVLQAKLPVFKYMTWVLPTSHLPPFLFALPISILYIYYPSFLKYLSLFLWIISSYCPAPIKFSPAWVLRALRGTTLCNQHCSQPGPSHGWLHGLSLHSSPVSQLICCFLPSLFFCFSSHARSYVFGFSILFPTENDDLLSTSIFTAFISKISMYFLFWNHPFSFHIFYSSPWMKLPPLPLWFDPSWVNRVVLSPVLTGAM